MNERITKMENRLTLLQGGKSNENQHEEENCCPKCAIRNQVVSDFLKMIEDKEMEIEEALDIVFDIGYDVGYKMAFRDDIEMKMEFLTQEEFIEKEED